MPRLRRYQYQVRTGGDRPIVPFGWFGPLTVPTARRPSLYTRGYAQTFWSSFTPTPPTPSLATWFGGLSEPQRFPKGLRAQLQRTLGYYDYPFPNVISMTITISATETNSDTLVALFSLAGAAARAEVSIEEVGVPHSIPISIIE